MRKTDPRHVEEVLLTAGFLQVSLRQWRHVPWLRDGKSFTQFLVTTCDVLGRAAVLYIECALIFCVDLTFCGFLELCALLLSVSIYTIDEVFTCVVRSS